MNTNKQMQPMLKAIADFLDHEGGEINMRRDRPYNGQYHTDKGIRGSQMISGVTMRDLKDAFIRAFIISHPSYKSGTWIKNEPNFTLGEECKKGPDACICENDVFRLKGSVDPLAVSQNLTCEIEKLMGIYPNLPGYTKVGYNEEPVKLTEDDTSLGDFPDSKHWN
jgi:hypothetical protein